MFLPQTVRELATVVDELIDASAGEGFTVREYRDRIGIGRNAVIEILEYFDRIGLTLRNGQVRLRRRPSNELF